MEPQISAALIAAIASLVVAIMAWVSGTRRARVAHEEQQELAKKQGELASQLEDHKDALARQIRLEERALTAEAELDRVRQPLLAAAIDLAHRINNIRVDWFHDYLSSPEPMRREVAMKGTLYRFARYWFVVESLYDRADLGKLLAEPSTRPVAATLRQIGQTFASDQHDGGRLMVWREEQRAIAELTRAPDEPAGSIGFASFFAQYDEKFASWFAFFSRDLPNADTSERLRLVQQLLGELIEQLAPAGESFYEEQLERIKQGSMKSRPS